MTDQHTNNRFRLGSAIIEPARNRITEGQESHRVTKRDMEVLMYLCHRGTEVVSREEIIAEVWTDTVVNEEVLTLSISRLRNALSDSPKAPRLIETIPKKGYRLMLVSQSFAPSEQKLASSLEKKSRIGIAVLAILLLIFASLYFIVRMEYQSVSDSQMVKDTIGHLA